MPKQRIPYDKLWKGIVNDYFEDFLAMFLPELYEQVDFSVPFRFLEQELQAVSIDKTLKAADKLVHVTLKDGVANWVYVHVEFETSPKGSIFGERMYGYNYRIHDGFDKEITAIVIYTGSYVPKVFDRYEHSKFGTTITYIFNSYIVKNQNEADLIANQNPFAIVVLANLYVLQSKNDDKKRLTLKEQIYKIAQERNYEKEKVDRLIIFLTELIKLPKNLETEFSTHIYKSKKSENMPAYIGERSRNLADHIAKQEYGQSFTELKAETKQTAATLAKTIVYMYAELKLPLEKIVEAMGVEAEYVKTILKKNKLIKK